MTTLMGMPTDSQEYDRHLARQQAQMQRENLEAPERERAALIADLDRDVPERVRMRPIDTALAAQRAEGEATAARQRLEAHDRNRPRDPGSVSAWTAERLRLATEADAYADLLTDARADYAAAERELTEARRRVQGDRVHQARSVLRSTQAQTQQAIERKEQELAELRRACNARVGDAAASAQRWEHFYL